MDVITHPYPNLGQSMFLKVPLVGSQHECQSYYDYKVMFASQQQQLAQAAVTLFTSYSQYKWP